MEFFTPGHLIVLAIVALVLFFGWKQLPEMSRSLGRSLRIFKTEIKGMSEDDKARQKAEQAQPPALPAPPPLTPPAAPTASIAEPAGERAGEPVAETAPRPRPRPAPNAVSDPVSNTSSTGQSGLNGRAPGAPDGAQ
jgi:sec-independent protein translocase protein TatA